MKLSTTPSIRVASILFTFALTALAQVEVLRNSDVVALAQAEVSTEVLLKKITTANSAFDVTTGGLIALKSSRVPDEVITAMVDHQVLIPPNADDTPAFSESGSRPNSLLSGTPPPRTKKEIVETARTIAFEKSSAQPSRQALGRD